MLIVLCGANYYDLSLHHQARKKHDFEEVCQRVEELEASQNLHLCREEAILSAMVNQHHPTALLSPSVSNLSVSEAAGSFLENLLRGAK